MFHCCSSRGVSTKPPLLQVLSRSLRSLTLQSLCNLANTIWNSRQHTVELSARLDALFFVCIKKYVLPQDLLVLTPSASAASNTSANSPFIPDTAVLIFHEHYCHLSLPPQNDSIEPSHVQLLTLKLFLLSCCRCWDCTLWLQGLLLLLHLRLRLLLLLHLHLLLSDYLHQLLLLRLLLLEPSLHDSQELRPPATGGAMCSACFF